MRRPFRYNPGKIQQLGCDPRIVRLSIEPLEVRCLLDAVAVSNTSDLVNGNTSSIEDLIASDGGDGISLREALLAANETGGEDFIDFNIPTTDSGFNAITGVWTIRPSEPLPTITGPVQIDGYTQSGASPNTLANGINAVLTIELDGSNAGPFSPGLEISGGNSTVRGLVINRFSLDAIALIGSGGHRIDGNFLGTDPTGTLAAPNLTGVFILNSALNTIGGASPAARNLLSGNGHPATFGEGSGAGVDIANAGSTGNRVLGNFIGTDVSGLLPLGNEGDGVRVSGFVSQNSYATTNSIGGTAAGDGNLISGNEFQGVDIFRGTANRVEGNLIGTIVTGDAPLGNGRAGVQISEGTDNVIGGTEDGAGNVISANLSGVIVFAGLPDAGPRNATRNRIQGNLIGTDITGQFALSNENDGVILETAAASTAAVVDNTVGGTDADDGAVDGDVKSRNVISGNANLGIGMDGVGTSNNRVVGNYIGVDTTGSTAVPNRTGVSITGGASGNRVGGTELGDGNVISGNEFYGVELADSQTTDNKLWGNLIGVAANGEDPVGNLQHGVYVLDDATGNMIGGDDDGAGNIIAFSGASLAMQGHGVVIESGIDNQIRRNSIHSNAGRGIDLGNDSFTINDYFDSDDGANELQNFPVVTRVEFFGGTKRIWWKLANAVTDEDYTFDFFSNSELDPSGFGEGEKYLFTATESLPKASESMSIEFSIEVPATETFISATVTDSFGNTSEFSMVDTDGDALADAWELFGIDVDEDGTLDLDPLILHGASPLHKDIFVEVDAMEGRNPDPAALVDVVSAFAASPAELVQNPDGATGIHLHIELGGDLDIPRVPWNNLDPNDWPRGFDAAKNGADTESRDGTFGLPEDRGPSNVNWPNQRLARSLVYRYAIFADTYDNSTLKGLAERGGNDFFITLGGFGEVGGTQDEQAGVFMHELGHTLHLRHGGGDEDNFKPNYNSVMNYTWAVPYAGSGFETSWQLDYSRYLQDPIDELSIDENAGFGGDPGRVVPIGPAVDEVTMQSLKPDIVPQNGPVDLDGDGMLTDAQRDVNFLGDTNGDDVIDDNDSTRGDLLAGHEDWSQLQFSFVGGLGFSINASLGAALEFDREMTYEDVLLLASIGIGPGLLQFSHNRYEQVEGDTVATITVARAGGIDGPVSVDYQILAGGSATGGEDYDETQVSGTLHIADGQHLQTFAIPLLDDVLYEGTETILLELTNASGGAILGSRSTATLEIIEPMLVSFGTETLDVDESAGTAAVEVNLFGELGQILSEDVVITIRDLLSGSAVPGVNYELPAENRLMFPAGAVAGASQSLLLTLLDNDSPDPTRTLELGISPVDSYVVTFADPATLKVRIIDDEVGALAGDSNGNGSVDAADYTVWRDTLGSTSDLRADANQDGLVDQVDYEFWKGNFGNMLPPGAASLASSDVDLTHLRVVSDVGTGSARAASLGTNLNDSVGRTTFDSGQALAQIGFEFTPLAALTHAISAAAHASSTPGPQSSSLNDDLLLLLVTDRVADETAVTDVQLVFSEFDNESRGVSDRTDESELLALDLIRRGLHRVSSELSAAMT